MMFDLSYSVSGEDEPFKMKFNEVIFVMEDVDCASKAWTALAQFRLLPSVYDHLQKMVALGEEMNKLPAALPFCPFFSCLNNNQNWFRPLRIIRTPAQVVYARKGASAAAAAQAGSMLAAPVLEPLPEDGAGATSGPLYRAASAPVTPLDPAALKRNAPFSVPQMLRQVSRVASEEVVEEESEAVEEEEDEDDEPEEEARI